MNCFNTYGAGTYTWNTDEKYEGEWNKGLRNGTGKYTIMNNGHDSALLVKVYIRQWREYIRKYNCCNTKL